MTYRQMIAGLVLIALIGAVPIPPVGKSAGQRVGSGPGYGVTTLAAPDRLDRAKAMGFNWIKILAAWRNIQPQDRFSFSWTALDGDVERATSRGMAILLRVDQPPAWATGTDAYNAPPIDDETLADFLGALATRYRGRIAAYEIWNEPNTSLEWGGRSPDPAKFARMLQALYPRVKSADPAALVITGGVATTGDEGNAEAWGDLNYLRSLYQAGAKGSFDGIGSHPYGGPYPPEIGKSAAGLGVYFRRAEEHRSVAESFGDDVAIWPTEVGWLFNQDGNRCRLEEYDSYHAAWQVSEQVQADYLVRAFRYAEEHWPWSGPIFLYNLDFAVDPWRPRCDPNRFFSIVRGNGAGLWAYAALTAMPRYERVAPSVQFSGVPPVQRETTFYIDWTGTDAGSGISSYDVQFRQTPTLQWGDLLTNTAPAVLEVDGEDRQTYQFRVRAMDRAGNLGGWTESPTTTVSLSGYLLPTVPAVVVYVGSNGSSGGLTVRNYGGAPLNWGASPSAPWLQLQPSGGHLGGGGEQSISFLLTGTIPVGPLTGAVVLTSTGWQTGGPVAVEVRLVERVYQSYLPSSVIARDPTVTAVTIPRTRGVPIVRTGRQTMTGQRQGTPR